MADLFLRKLWLRVQQFVQDNATHSTIKFFPDPAAEPLQPYAGYIRVWLAEGFLSKQKTWGNQHFPALHGGVSLNFLGNQAAAFTRFERPPDGWTTPGAQLDFAITPLVPFNGGTVEIEAALYQATVGGPIATGVALAGNLASLMGPPLASAAAIADKLSNGLDAILAETGNKPLLALHWTMVSPAGATNMVRQGHLAVIGQAEDTLGGRLSIRDGRLHLDRGAGPALLTGVDYLVVRVECRKERDDWRLPELDQVIRDAGDAFIRGQTDTFEDRRKDAIARAWNSSDLSPIDRKRVALLVRDELDSLGELGAVPAGLDQALEHIAPARLLGQDDPQLDALKLTPLLAR
jgi:hypothetical protein